MWVPLDAYCGPRFYIVAAVDRLDEAMTSAGRHFHTAALDVGKPAIGEVAIGSMICFDRENPESARLLALHGAEVLLVPNACGVGKQLLDQFAVRALENGVNTVMANHVSCVQSL